MDGSPEAEALLAREYKFTSKDGNLLFFDPEGVHRGGMVDRGERIILQIALEPK